MAPSILNDPPMVLLDFRGSAPQGYYRKQARKPLGRQASFRQQGIQNSCGKWVQNGVKIEALRHQSSRLVPGLALAGPRWSTGATFVVTWLPFGSPRGCPGAPFGNTWGALGHLRDPWATFGKQLGCPGSAFGEDLLLLVLLLLLLRALAACFC